MRYIYVYTSHFVRKDINISRNQTSVDKLVYSDNIDNHFIIIDKTVTIVLYNQKVLGIYTSMNINIDRSINDNLFRNIFIQRYD